MSQKSGPFVALFCGLVQTAHMVYDWQVDWFSSGTGNFSARSRPAMTPAGLPKRMYLVLDCGRLPVPTHRPRRPTPAHRQRRPVKAAHPDQKDSKTIARLRLIAYAFSICFDSSRARLPCLFCFTSRTPCLLCPPSPLVRAGGEGEIFETRLSIGFSIALSNVPTSRPVIRVLLEYFG